MLMLTLVIIAAILATASGVWVAVVLVGCASSCSMAAVAAAVADLGGIADLRE